MNLFLVVMVAINVVFASVHAASPAAETVDAQTAACRELAKYSLVFRLIPTRISQMLQVINAYPVANEMRRVELLQSMVGHMHEKYRFLQQLHRQVTELEGRLPMPDTRKLADRTKKLAEAMRQYQITLVSTMSLIDTELSRTIDMLRQKGATVVNDNDDAYVAARAVLHPSKVDVLIASVAEGKEVSRDIDQRASSVKQEIKELRDEVSFLKARLQSKSMAEKEVDQSPQALTNRISELNKENARVIIESKTLVEGLGEAAKTPFAPVSVARQSAKNGQQHSSSVQGLYAWWYWIQDRLLAAYKIVADVVTAGVSNLRANVSWLVERVTGDTQKAAEHVGSRLKEVHETAPDGVAAVTSSLVTVRDWIVDSWMRIGCMAVDAFNAVQARAAVLDDTMRAFVCSICAQARAAQKPQWGADAWSAAAEWSTQIKTYMVDSLNVVRSRIFGDAMENAPASEKPSAKHAQ